MKHKNFINPLDFDKIFINDVIADIHLWVGIEKKNE